jgi:hypothetical protein
MGMYKLCVVDALNPDTHFDKRKRKTLDYIENEGQEGNACWYKNNIAHVGPFKIHHTN